MGHELLVAFCSEGVARHAAITQPLDVSTIGGYGDAHPTRPYDKEPPVPQDEPRELTPIQKFWEPTAGFRDYSVNPVPADTPEPEDEVEEVEEVLTPAPKDESALASAVLPDSHPVTAPPASETPVPSEPSTPTEKLEAAVKASGKDSESNEDEQPTPSSAPPVPASSSQSSSSETSPGKPTPPASAQPPFVAPPPVVPTTPK